MKIFTCCYKKIISTFLRKSYRKKGSFKFRNFSLKLRDRKLSFNYIVFFLFVAFSISFVNTTEAQNTLNQSEFEPNNTPTASGVQRIFKRVTAGGYIEGSDVDYWQISRAPNASGTIPIAVVQTGVLPIRRVDLEKRSGGYGGPLVSSVRIDNGSHNLDYTGNYYYLLKVSPKPGENPTSNIYQVNFAFATSGELPVYNCNLTIDNPTTSVSLTEFSNSVTINGLNAVNYGEVNNNYGEFRMISISDSQNFSTLPSAPDNSDGGHFTPGAFYVDGMNTTPDTSYNGSGDQVVYYSTNGNDTNPNLTITGLSPGTTYYIKAATVDNCNGRYFPGTGVVRSFTTCTPLTNAPSGLSVSTTGETSANVSSFTAPSGTVPANQSLAYVVLANSTNQFTAPTTGNSSLPTADTSWNNNGQQVVYSGTSISPNVNITGLIASQTYYFKVYAAYLCGGNYYFEQVGSSTVSAITCGAPSHAGTFEVTGSSIRSNSFEFKANSNATLNATGVLTYINTSNTFTDPGATLSSLPTADTSWNNSGQQLVISSSQLSNTVSITNLAPNTTYFIKSYSVGRLCNGNYYVNTSSTTTRTVTTCTPLPTSVASNPVFNNITSTSMQLSSFTTPPTGGAPVDGYIISMNTADSFSSYAGSSVPTANTVYSSGQQVIYVGNNASPNINITGLSANTSYYFSINAYNNCGSGINYQTPGYRFSKSNNNKTTPVITFNDIIKKVGDADFNISATSTNTATPIQYQIITKPNNTDSTTLTDNGNGTATVQIGNYAGIATIEAYQAGNENFSEARVSMTLTINKGTPTLTIKPATSFPDQLDYFFSRFFNPIFNLNDAIAINNSGASPTFEIVGNNHGFATSGTNNATVDATNNTSSAVVNFRISVPETANYIAHSITTHFLFIAASAVNGVYQVDYDFTLPHITQIGVAHTINPTLPHAFKESHKNSIAYSIVAPDPTNSVLSGNQLTPNAEGTVTVQLVIPEVIAPLGSTTLAYSAKTVQKTIGVGRQSQIVNFPSIAQKTYGDANFALTATSNRGLPITYSSSNTSVATVSGSTVTIVGAGTTKITASHPGDVNYFPSSSEHDLVVQKRTIQVTPNSGQSKNYGYADPTLTYQITQGSLVGSDSFTGSLSRAAGESLGNYNIAQGTLALSNNYQLSIVENIPFQIVQGAGQGSIAYSGGFTEESANTGAVTGSIIATLSGNEVFASSGGSLAIGTDVTLTGIPTGLTPSVVISGDGTTATLTLSGNATNHQAVNNVADITFNFANNVFSGGNAARVLNATGPASSGKGITFTENASIAYSGAGFSESSGNTGAVEGSIVATITGNKTFANADGNLTVGTDVTLGNIPAGLVASIAISGNGKIATLSLSGNATNHQGDNNVTDITFDFKNTAFVGGDAASVLNATGPASSNKGINFAFNPKITYSGIGFYEASTNTGFVLGSIVATITGNKTFTNADGNLTVGTDVTLGNIPAGLVASIAISADGKVATLSLSGSATNHQAANNVANITFDFKDSAFTGGNRASVLNATGPASSGKHVVFTNNPSIAYTGGISETSANLGAVENTINIKLTEDTFAQTDLSSHVTLQNIPAGLSAQLSVTDANLSWTAKTNSINSWYDIVYGNGTYILIAKNAVAPSMATSTDLNAWNNVSSLAKNNFSSITYGKGLFVAAYNAGGSQSDAGFATSSNGVDWSFKTLPLVNFNGSFVVPNLAKVFHINNTFFAVGTTGMFSSDDTTNWSFSRPVSLGSTQAISSMAYGNGRYVVLTSTGNGTSEPTLTSSTNILSTSAASWSSTTNIPQNGWSSITYGNGLFVAVAPSGTNRVVTSPDGINWTLRNAAGAHSWKNVTYGAGTFVAVADTGQMMVSSDGINWTMDATVPGSSWSSIKYLNNNFIAVASTGTQNLLHTTSYKTTATLTLSGNATNHQVANNVSNITFDFANTAFTGGNASLVSNATGPASSNVGVTFTNNSSIAYSGTGFSETSANLGAVSGSIVATLTGSETFTKTGSTLIVGTDVILGNIPAGLTPSVAISGSGKIATLTLTGSATNHQTTNNVADITFDFKNTAFAGGNAAIVLSATGPASSGKSIAFTDNLSIGYYGLFGSEGSLGALPIESNSNIGSIEEGGIQIRLLPEAEIRTNPSLGFSNPGGALVVGTDVILGNVPEGLTPLINVSPNSSSAVLTFTGTATNHQSANNVSNITFDFKNSAFQTGNAAVILNATGPVNSNLGITFTDNPSIAYSGTGFSETSANLGSVQGSIVATLTGSETFTKTGGTLIVGTDVVLGNIPAGLTPSVAISANGKIATLTLTGSATNHQNNVVDITFDFKNTAFAGGNAAIVLSATGPASSNKGITFTANSSIAYSGTGFSETSANLGAVSGSIVATLTGSETFTKTGGTLIVGTDVTLGNIPDGLTPSVAISANGKEATLTLTGSAINHQNNVADITFDFKNSAFAGGNAAPVLNATGPASSNKGISFTNNSSISYSGGLNETLTNTGSLSDGIIATLTGGETFVTSGLLSHVTLGNVPAGLTPTVIVSNNGTTATFGLTGSVSNHQESDNVTDITFDFANGAFVGGNAASVFNATGPASSRRGISFIDNPSISYSGGFNETSANLGSVSGSIVATLTGDETFTNTNSSLTVGTDVILGNIPAGFTSSVDISGNRKVATLTLSGNATNHQAINNITNITFAFANSAFTGGNAASVLNATGGANSNRGITYTNNASIVYSGAGFNETSANMGSVSGSIVATLTGGGETFRNADGTLTVGTDVTLGNIPAGLTPSVAISGNGKIATLTLTGTATNHQQSHGTGDITFTFANSAFTGNIAAAVFNATGPVISKRGVYFTNNGSIAYTGGFSETSTNEGTVENSINIKLTGETFAQTNLTSHVTLGNIPTGLSAQLSVTDNNLSWSAQALNDEERFDVAYGNGVYVIVNNNTKVSTSSDGVTWENRTVSHSLLQSVAYGSGLFVIPIRKYNSEGINQNNGFLTSSDGITWTYKSLGNIEGIDSNNLNLMSASKIKYINNRFFVTTSGPQGILSSSDGMNWSFSRPVSLGSTQIISSMAYGNGRYVVLTSTGNGTTEPSLTSSTDVFSSSAASWSSTTSIPQNGWSSITYGNGLFVAVAPSGTNRVVTSPDGINWTLRNAAGAHAWKSVTYGAGTFVAVATDEKMMTSSDGINWTMDTTVPNSRWKSVKYLNDNFIAVADNGAQRLIKTTSYKTTATLTLSGSAINHDANNNVPDITFNFANSAFTSNNAASVSNATGPASSNKGITFTANSSIAYSGAGFSETAANTGAVSGSIIASLSGSESFASNNITSHLSLGNVPSGLSAQLTVAPPTWTTQTALTGNWKDIAYGNNTYVAVGNSGSGTNKIMRSTDGGLTWTATTIPQSFELVSVTYGDGLFFALTDNATATHKVFSSPDGVTWTQTGYDGSMPMNEVRYLNGVLFTIGYNQVPFFQNIYVSTNKGAKWTRSLVSGSLASITYGNGKYVVVNGSNTSVTSAYSSNGTSWTTTEDSNTSGISWVSVTYGKGTFVAVSSDGRVMTSSNGISWTLGASSIASNLRSVTFGGGIFMAVGSNASEIVTSTDGVNWTSTAIAEVTGSGWNNIVHANGTVIAVAEGDTQKILKTTKLFQTATLTLSGSATNHQEANNVTDITFNFANGALTGDNAASVLNATGPASSNIGVTFTSNSSIAYSGTGFSETSANTGAVSGSIVATLTGGGETFRNADGTLTVGTDVTLGNIPAGLTPSVAISSNGKVATLTLSGSATNHQAANNVAGITFNFANSAFAGNNAAAILNATGPVNSNKSVIFTNNPIVKLSLKVFLHGPYNTTNNLMNDDLRSLGVIPTTSPYTSAPATANASVFNVTGSNAIVDWVLVEIRDKSNIAGGVLARISAFVQRDGDVVAVDGTSEISTFLPADTYYVSIAHRNHLPIVTGQAHSLSSTATSIDFTNNINMVFGKNNAMHPVAEGVYGMFAGDANQNKSVQTTDVVSLAPKIGLINVYNNSDCNMNGHVQTTDFVISARTIGRIKQF